MVNFFTVIPFAYVVWFRVGLYKFTPGTQAKIYPTLWEAKNSIYTQSVSPFALRKLFSVYSYTHTWFSTRVTVFEDEHFSTSALTRVWLRFAEIWASTATLEVSGSHNFGGSFQLFGILNKLLSTV